MSRAAKVAPGAYRPPADRWGRFETLARRLPARALVLADARVLRLHPGVARALRGEGRIVVALAAGERAKSLSVLERVLQQAVALPRSAWVVCVGGGTLGDLGTVAAHVLKRGLSLLQVPTTLLAAVDSSVGGKGAVHLAQGKEVVKNALGVFHYAEEAWVCPELFDTLSPRQLREGRIEAWKMVVSLDAGLFAAYRRRAPSLSRLVRDARQLKDRVCFADPYEHEGRRQVLNFGHTFGHVIESVTHFGVSHGDAVGMGVLCALDVGRALGVTPEGLAGVVEEVFAREVRAPGRPALARALRGAGAARVAGLLAADKKAGSAGELRMVLLRALGRAERVTVQAPVWRGLLGAWVRGGRP